MTLPGCGKIAPLWSTYDLYTCEGGAEGLVDKGRKRRRHITKWSVYASTLCEVISPHDLMCYRGLMIDHNLSIEPKA